LDKTNFIQFNASEYVHSKRDWLALNAAASHDTMIDRKWSRKAAAFIPEGVLPTIF